MNIKPEEIITMTRTLMLQSSELLSLPNWFNKAMVHTILHPGRHSLHVNQPNRCS